MSPHGLNKNTGIAEDAEDENFSVYGRPFRDSNALAVRRWTLTSRNVAARFLITLLMSFSLLIPQASPAEDASESTQFRITLGLGGDWAIGSFRTEWDGSARTGEAQIYRVGFSYNRQHATFVNFEYHQIDVKRNDLDSQDVVAKWNLIQCGVLQRYMFHAGTYRPFAELGLYMVSADFETNPEIRSMQRVGNATPGGSLGFGMELAFEAPTIVEFGARLNYHQDSAEYDDLVFTFLDAYIGFTFLLNM